jgi:3-hydroxybutyrate dehydrogenase
MKTVIISGSTSGIGLGIAESFALAGHNVVLNGLGKSEEIEATRARLSGLGAGEVIFHGANMLEPEEIADLVAQRRRPSGLST